MSPDLQDPMDHLVLLKRLAQASDRRIVLLVLDGVGDLRTADQPQTPLEAAESPNLDALAAAGALGRIVPVATGITPGSGPGHLALFGYDPLSPEADIGRGALEALGMGIEFEPGDVVARGNFATLDGDGRVTDRRAGRIPTEENRRLVEILNQAIARQPVHGVKASFHSGEGHRFVLLLEGSDLSPEIHDTDPQETGVPPLEPTPRDPEAPHVRGTLEKVEKAMAVAREALAGESAANGFLLRGFASLPHLPTVSELYRLRAACFAGYPLYRGVAKLSGMEIVDIGKSIQDIADGVRRHLDDFDFFFLHVKGTDMAGEDGDPEAKRRVIEEADRVLVAELREMFGERDVIAVTGDHSTPVPMAAHSWHPVPLLVKGPDCFVDGETTYTESSTLRGHLGTFPARELMGLLLANADRLKKYGA